MRSTRTKFNNWICVVTLNDIKPFQVFPHSSSFFFLASLVYSLTQLICDYWFSQLLFALDSVYVSETLQYNDTIRIENMLMLMFCSIRYQCSTVTQRMFFTSLFCSIEHMGRVREWVFRYQQWKFVGFVCIHCTYIVNGVQRKRA